MTAEDVVGAQTADRECRDCGYKPELKRTLGSFQVFAVSFAFISVAVGIFGTYNDVLRDAGPVGKRGLERPRPELDGTELGGRLLARTAPLR